MRRPPKSQLVKTLPHAPLVFLENCRLQRPLCLNLATHTPDLGKLLNARNIFDPWHRDLTSFSIHRLIFEQTSADYHPAFFVTSLDLHVVDVRIAQDIINIGRIPARVVQALFVEVFVALTMSFLLAIDG